MNTFKSTYTQLTQAYIVYIICWTNKPATGRMGCSFDELEPDPFDDPGPILLWENSNKVKCKLVAYISEIYSLLVSNYIIYIETD